MTEADHDRLVDYLLHHPESLDLKGSIITRKTSELEIWLNEELIGQVDLYIQTRRYERFYEVKSTPSEGLKIKGYNQCMTTKSWALKNGIDNAKIYLVCPKHSHAKRYNPLKSDLIITEFM